MTEATGFLIRVDDGPAVGYQVHSGERPDRILTLALFPKGWQPVMGRRQWPTQAVYERQERRMRDDGRIVYPYTLKTARAALSHRDQEDKKHLLKRRFSLLAVRVRMTRRSPS